MNTDKAPTDKRTREYKEWKEMQGAGDLVHSALNNPVVKPITNAIKKTFWKDEDECGCKERKEKLNKLLPFRFKARCLTEKEYNEYKAFVERRSLRIPRKDVIYIAELFASVFNRNKYVPCNTCSGKATMDMITKLDVVFDQYKKDLDE